jgi:hypothetical protein
MFGYPDPRVTLDGGRNVLDGNCRSLLSLLRWCRACAAWFPAGAAPRTWPTPCGAAGLATIPLGFALAFVWGAAGADIFTTSKSIHGHVDGMAGRPCLQRPCGRGRPHGTHRTVRADGAAATMHSTCRARAVHAALAQCMPPRASVAPAVPSFSFVCPPESPFGAHLY